MYRNRRSNRAIQDYGSMILVHKLIVRDGKEREGRRRIEDKGGLILRKRKRCLVALLYMG